jgi:hypothetical protein
MSTSCPESESEGGNVCVFMLCVDKSLKFEFSCPKQMLETILVKYEGFKTLVMTNALVSDWCFPLELKQLRTRRRLGWTKLMLHIGDVWEMGNQFRLMCLKQLSDLRSCFAFMDNAMKLESFDPIAFEKIISHHCEFRDLLEGWAEHATLLQFSQNAGSASDDLCDWCFPFRDVHALCQRRLGWIRLVLHLSITWNLGDHFRSICVTELYTLLSQLKDCHVGGYVLNTLFAEQLAGASGRLCWEELVTKRSRNKVEASANNRLQSTGRLRPSDAPRGRVLIDRAHARMYFLNPWRFKCVAHAFATTLSVSDWPLLGQRTTVLVHRLPDIIQQSHGFIQICQQYDFDLKGLGETPILDEITKDDVVAGCLCSSKRPSTFE